MGKRRDPVGEQVGLNIRRLRWAIGLSQDDVGRRLGVTFQQVQKYETGKDRLSLELLVRLRQTLGCDYAAFFAGVGGEAAGPSDDEGEYATLKWSRSVQSIGDRRVRHCLIDLGRELARCERPKA